MVTMFLTAGLYAQKQVSTAEAFAKKVEMKKEKQQFGEKGDPNQKYPISSGTSYSTKFNNSKGTVYLTTSGGSYATEKWVDITTEVDGAGTVVWAQGDGTYGNGAGLLTDEPITGLTDGVTYYINCYDKYDDSWDNTLYEVRTASGGGRSITCQQWRQHA